MKVCFLSTAAGPMGSFQAGRSYDIEASFAIDLIAAGAVVALEPLPRAEEPEMALAPEAVERAVVDRPKRGRPRKVA